MLKNRLFQGDGPILIVMIAGLCLVGVGMAILSVSVPAPVYAQDDSSQGAEYVGAHECRTCHRTFARPFADSPHALALQNVAGDKTPILGDFSLGEDLLTLQLPGEPTARPVTADDIVYAIGAGKYVQRYLVADGEADFLVLPVEWNTVEGKWQPFSLAEQWPDPAYVFGPNCAYCHTTALDTQTYTWNDDGVLCEACHGPGSQHVEAAGKVGAVMTLEQSTAVQNAIDGAGDAQVCGQCHTRGTAPDGIHPYPVGYVPGGSLDESVFVPAMDEAHWYSTGNARQPNMQYLEWLASTHRDSVTVLQGSEEAQAECLSCHSVAYRRAEAKLAETWVGGDPFNPQLLLYIIRQAGLSTEVDEQQLVDQLLPLLADLNLQADASLTYDELVSRIMAAVGFDARDANPDLPLLPQVVPAILEHLRDAGRDTRELQQLIRQLMPLVLEQVMQSQTDTLDASHAVDLEQFGVTCATCHDPHSTVDYPNLLVNEPYALCVDCHSSTTVGANTVHHPAQEMYEGVSLVENVGGVPGAHFTVESGPDCQTCHMPDVPVTGDESRVSHTLNPILPGETIPADVLQDTCTTCHADRVDAAGMQTLINDVQRSTHERLDAIRAKMTGECAPWVQAAVDFVAGDGSLGIHNYAYADKLLDSVEVAIGLQPVTAGAADVPLCMSAVVVEAQEARVSIKSDKVFLGLTQAQTILLALGILVALTAGLTLLFPFARGALWARMLSLLALVLGVGLVIAAFVLPSNEPQIITTGDNSTCAVCHWPGAKPYVLSDGTALPMAVDAASLAASVHGDSMEEGRMGCVDCHGKDYFPHAGLTPTSMTVYRVEMSAVCIVCHAADTQHYTDVVKRNISVGCADCHSAHYVAPASELPPIIFQ